MDSGAMESSVVNPVEAADADGSARSQDSEPVTTGTGTDAAHEVSVVVVGAPAQAVNGGDGSAHPAAAGVGDLALAAAGVAVGAAVQVANGGVAPPTAAVGGNVAGATVERAVKLWYGVEAARLLTILVNTITYCSYVRVSNNGTTYYCSDKSMNDNSRSGADIGGTLFLTFVVCAFTINHARNVRRLESGHVGVTHGLDVAVNWLVGIAYSTWGLAVSPYVPTCHELKLAGLLGVCGGILCVYLVIRLPTSVMSCCAPLAWRVVAIGGFVTVVLCIVFLAINNVTPPLVDWILLLGHVVSFGTQHLVMTCG